MTGFIFNSWYILDLIEINQIPIQNLTQCYRNWINNRDFEMGFIFETIFESNESKMTISTFLRKTFFGT